MDFSSLIPVGTLVLGIVLTFLFGLWKDHLSDQREERKAERAEAARRAATGRDHAIRALEIVRTAQRESWARKPEEGSQDINLDGLNLEVAEAEIDLVPDPVLRPRLASVLNAVRYPWTLANGSYAQGHPIETQREGLYLLREALAAYVREEPTPSEPDALSVLAKANEDAHNEREEWERQRREVEKEMRAEKTAEAKRASENPTS